MDVSITQSRVLFAGTLSGGTNYAAALNLNYAVYAIRTYQKQGIENEFVKIGFAKVVNLPSRLTDLQIGCPFQLGILGFRLTENEREARVVEKRYHRKFWPAHTHGEWFRLDHPVVQKSIHNVAHIPGTFTKKYAVYALF